MLLQCPYAAWTETINHRSTNLRWYTLQPPGCVEWPLLGSWCYARALAFHYLRAARQPHAGIALLHARWPNFAGSSAFFYPTCRHVQLYQFHHPRFLAFSWYRRSVQSLGSHLADHCRWDRMLQSNPGHKVITGGLAGTIVSSEGWQPDEACAVGDVDRTAGRMRRSLPGILPARRCQPLAVCHTRPRHPLSLDALGQ